MAETPSDELKVFISHRSTTCDECKEELGHNAWIVLAGDRGALCLSCADLDHLPYLASGNATLTRRARKHATLSAVVLRWSRSRKRYERQGILVDEAALHRAEEECLADEDVRILRRERAAERRAELDEAFVAKFADRIRELFPRCPKGREQVIAEHACEKYSGRVGRTASAKSLEEDAIRLAVVAHVRHVETNYDRLMFRGTERGEARMMVSGSVADVMMRWEAAPRTI